MPVKHYGIYLCYAPGLDLRHEGLGRYLADALVGFGVVLGSRTARTLKPLFFLKSRFPGIFRFLSLRNLILRLNQQMEIEEPKRLLQLINELSVVRAWYCPTAFWPAFNEIAAPKLMCVPDVVQTDFAIGFSEQGGDGLLTGFETVEKAIYTG